ncbi:hypothetical protein [Borreliella afzelii]|uniref:hypothetical protein n=2 Tax=Borreliella afzelii TaxID=29518 RepID=UPI003AF5A252
MVKKVVISSTSIMLSIFSLSCDLRKENAGNKIGSVISSGKDYWDNLGCKYLSGSEKSIFNAFPKSKKSQVFYSILKKENGKDAIQLLINWGIDFQTASSIAISIDKELVELKNSQIKLSDNDSYEVGNAGNYNLPYSSIDSDNNLLSADSSFYSNLDSNDNANTNYLNSQNYTYQEYTNKQAQEMQEIFKKYKIFKENAYKLSQTLNKSTSYAEELNTKLSEINTKENNKFILKADDIKDIIRLIARIKMTQYTDLSKKILDNNFSNIASDEESARYVLLYKNTNSPYLEVRKILGSILSKISSIVGGSKANVVDIEDSEKIKKAKEYAQGVLDILKSIDSGEAVEAVLNKAKQLEKKS